MTFSLSAHAAANRLIDSSSPYLLQHAYNPVDWYPWGEEAFAKARKENKPILLSIGYSTCYWCHVMEREIFENPEIARLMNKSIVSIKIDREQRPDVDELYMTATQLMTRGGGWPNNVFVTPDLKPFFAGTYFPPADFTSLIQQIHDIWTQDQAALKAQADRLASAIIQIKQQENHAESSSLPGSQPVGELISHFCDYYDNRQGGFYQAPKFPNEDALLFLLEAYRLTNNNTCLEMARGTLEKMAEGGIHDHVGGGFHRYSTDGQWRIPHFEKMLYNQALLGRAYTELYALSNTPVYRAVAEGIFDFTLRQMTHKDGSFYSALDAETDAMEGAYYAWTEAELHDALDTDSYAWLMKHYLLAEIPVIPGQKHADGKVLYLNQLLTESATERGLSYEDAVKKQQAVMTALRKARDKRNLPHLDNNIITSWNGLMIDAFARAGQRMEKLEYTEAARSAADFILANLRKQDGALYRTWRDGKAEIAAYFEDYAFMIQGLVSTYRATQEDKYLQAANELRAKAKQLFWDEKHGGYYFTDGSEQLLVRMKNAVDSAIPSGNAVMAQALLDLYEITGDAEWKQQTESLLN
ncbi:MAG: thioredoxin domain-containing protein, partial [Methylococcaceae bacterium]|nr:thioredoxin domain-containing protein [Methylococcaceae bacterium]